MSDLLAKIESAVPYLGFMGINLTLDDEGRVMAKMPYREHLIGNPLIPALHGGGIAALLEAVAIGTLAHERAKDDPDSALHHLPKTINITTDYLRPGLAKDSFAQAIIRRIGRRYATVHIMSWQDDIDSPIAESVAHFLVADWNTP